MINPDDAAPEDDPDAAYDRAREHDTVPAPRTPYENGRAVALGLLRLREDQPGYLEREIGCAHDWLARLSASTHRSDHDLSSTLTGYVLVLERFYQENYA